ncbi:hypothetical protein [Streptomyces sp. NPDC001828]|uniref:hypothetical protein n=1 Tax=Streptomyces sp. NPDC001828 TaxID=3364615 RepID=UPI0036BE54C0
MSPTSPAEQLLYLGRDFTRLNDAVTRLQLSPSTTATDVTAQAAAAQDLARSTLDFVHAQRTPRSPTSRTVCARMLDLAKLTNRASGHLLTASDIIKHRHAGTPARGRPERRSRREALSTVDEGLAFVRDMSAFCAEEALKAAELLVAEQHRRGVITPQRSPALSLVQEAAMRAVALGQVTICGGSPVVSQADIRVASSTIHALEARGFVAREDCVSWLSRERAHLTADGCHALVAAIGRPRAAAQAAPSRSAAAVHRTAR